MGILTQEESEEIEAQNQPSLEYRKEKFLTEYCIARAGAVDKTLNGHGTAIEAKQAWLEIRRGMKNG